MTRSRSSLFEGASPLVIGVTFLFGFAAVIGAGYLAFRTSVFFPTTAAFQCIVIGGLAAAVLALMSDSRLGQGLALVVAFALVRVGFLDSQGWRVTVAGVVVAFGVYLSCLIFDLLRREGIRFGKFLVLGPLFGGVYLAVTPLADLAALAGGDLVPVALHRIFLGVVIGDGVGFGAELASLLLSPVRDPAG